MTMREFINKYGTKTVPLVIKQLNTCTDEVITELANDLEEALEDYVRCWKAPDPS